jgi:hypothetical protein
MPLEQLLSLQIKKIFIYTQISCHIISMMADYIEYFAYCIP